MANNLQSSFVFYIVQYDQLQLDYLISSWQLLLHLEASVLSHPELGHDIYRAGVFYILDDDD